MENNTTEPTVSRKLWWRQRRNTIKAWCKNLKWLDAINTIIALTGLTIAAWAFVLQTSDHTQNEILLTQGKQIDSLSRIIQEIRKEHQLMGDLRDAVGEVRTVSEGQTVLVGQQVDVSKSQSLMVGQQLRISQEQVRQFMVDSIRSDRRDCNSLIINHERILRIHLDILHENWDSAFAITALEKIAIILDADVQNGWLSRHQHYYQVWRTYQNEIQSDMFIIKQNIYFFPKKQQANDSGMSIPHETTSWIPLVSSNLSKYVSASSDILLEAYPIAEEKSRINGRRFR